MRFLLSTFFAALTLATSAPAQMWGAGGCPAPAGPVGPPAFVYPVYPQPVYTHPYAPVQTPAPPPLEWSKWENGFWKLHRGSELVGAYSLDEGYQTWNGQAWVDAGNPPITPPVELKAKMQSWETEGVDLSKIASGVKFSRKGKECCEEEAVQAIHEAGQLVDDSKKPWFAVIGSKTDQQKVKDAIANSAKLKTLLADWRVKYYLPDSHHLRSWKTKKTGSPWMVFIRQDKDDPKGGDAVHELLTFENTEKLTAEVALATDKLDPNWKPPAPPPAPKLPEPSPAPGPSPSPGPAPVQIPDNAVPLAGLAGILYLLYRSLFGAKKS